MAEQIDKEPALEKRFRNLIEDINTPTPGEFIDVLKSINSHLNDISTTLKYFQRDAREQNGYLISSNKNMSQIIEKNLKIIISIIICLALALAFKLN